MREYPEVNNLKNTFCAHPLMAVKLMKPFLFVLILPVIKGLIQYVLYRRISGILTLEAAAFALIVVLSLLECYFFTVSVENDIITVKKGLLMRSVSVIKLSRLSSLTTTRNPADLIFKTVTCFINTEAGQKDKPDFECKLRISDAARLLHGVYGDKGRTAITFSPLKISAMAAATSSAFTGLIIGVPIINSIGKLLGIALSEMLLAEINTVSEELKTYFPPIVNALTLIFLISYGFSFAVTFFKYLRFRLYAGRERIEVRSGVFVLRRAVFKKSSVNDVCIEQSPLMRLFKLYSMRAAVAGYGNSKGEKAVIVPCGGKNEIDRHLALYFPRFSDKSRAFVRAAQTRRMLNRFLWLPRLYGLITVGISVAAAYLFSYFDRLVLFVCSILLLFILYYADLSRYNFKHGKILFGDRIYAQGSVGMTRRQFYCEKEKIGVIRLIRTPADRKHDTCKIDLITRSESADRIRVRNIDYRTAKQKIEKCFGIARIK